MVVVYSEGIGESAADILQGRQVELLEGQQVHVLDPKELFRSLVLDSVAS